MELNGSLDKISWKYIRAHQRIGCVFVSRSTINVLFFFLQLQSHAQLKTGETDVKFQLAKDTIETMLKSMYCIRDQLSDNVSATVGFSICYDFTVQAKINK